MRLSCECRRVKCFVGNTVVSFSDERNEAAGIQASGGQFHRVTFCRRCWDPEAAQTRWTFLRARPIDVLRVALGIRREGRSVLNPRSCARSAFLDN